MFNGFCVMQRKREFFVEHQEIVAVVVVVLQEGEDRKPYYLLPSILWSSMIRDSSWGVKLPLFKSAVVPGGGYPGEEFNVAWVY
ncbi:hypothetical protein B296_00002105 [Ensete ventricosum]|uniref:Uncharacterized protein n=1 Tax=Ensete ventricosum TaxID=4639 RepID=A0A427B978_ENSVE|nr:hypothetical protein B296_00002105 [Ensete ventricosum]